MDYQSRKKRKLSNVALILGLSSLLLPILFSFGILFIPQKPVLPIPWGMYIFKVIYLGIIISSLLSGIIALVLKPRSWNIDTTKIFIGLLLTSFSLFHFGRIIFFDQSKYE